MDNIEIWVDITYYIGIYQVSNFGRVKSLRYNKEKILKVWIDKDGYENIKFNLNKKRETFKVHRLVGYMFLGLDISNSNILVCHKDDNPRNNNIDNLFLGTSKDNSQDMIRKGRQKFAGGRCKKIIQFTKEGDVIKEWDSMVAAGFSLGLHPQNIGKCCSGKSLTSGGFTWKYTTTANEMYHQL